MNIALVLNYRSPESTLVCAESILKHCLGIDFVLIIDNASADDSERIIGQWVSGQDSNRVRFIVNSTNNGYAGGNNYGIRWARENLTPTYFWIVNSDAFVENDAFSPMLKIAHSQKGFVGSVVVSSVTRCLECYGGGAIYPLLGKARLYLKGVSLDRIPAEVGAPDYLMGCSLLFSNDLVDQLGYMDEEYFMYSEEVDWQFRGKGAGYGIFVCRDSVVYHEGSGSSGGKSPFYYYYRNRAAVRFNKRYFGTAVALISAFSLSGFMLVTELKSPKRLFAGVSGAFRGVLMNV
jgi:GT2 family glycosyltransferase